MRLELVDWRMFMKDRKFWWFYLRWEWLHCWRGY